MSNPYGKYSRRQFIKEFGTAAGLAVPFLKSSVAMGQTSTAPVRLLLVPLQHGWGVDVSAPFQASGSSFNIARPLDALQSIRNQCVFIDGLRSSFWGNAHDVNYSNMFTCSGPFEAPTNNTGLGGPFPLPTGPSIDWLIANNAQKDVLRLSANYRSFGAAYHPMSFDSSCRNLPYFTTARDAYMSFIDPLRQQQQNIPGSTSKKAEADALLKLLGKNANALMQRLDSNQKVKMEGYIASLNALGNRILSPSNTYDLSNITLPNLPGLTPGFNEMIDSYIDMIRVAFTLDTHRVAVLGLGEGVTNWNWTDTNNVTKTGNTFGADFHHEVAHYGEGASNINANPRKAYEGWAKWYLSKIVNLVNTLSSINDIDGKPLIENTIIVLMGEVGNGNHDTYNMTYTLIGGGGGVIRRNRWISTPKFDARNRNGFLWASRDINNNVVVCGNNYSVGISQVSASDLWVSIARLCGLNISTFGFDVYNNTPVNLTS